MAHTLSLCSSILQMAIPISPTIGSFSPNLLTAQHLVVFAAVYAGLICLAFSSFMLRRSVFMRPRFLIGFTTLAFTGTAQCIYLSAGRLWDCWHLLRFRFTHF